MSRTDVHRPWFVQIADPFNRHILYRYGWQQDVTSFKNISCGCRMCTGHDWRKQERRGCRHQWKKNRARGAWEDL